MASLELEVGKIYNFRTVVDMLLESNPKVCGKFNVHGKGCCLIDIFVADPNDPGLLLAPITNHAGQHIGFDLTAPGKLELRWACNHESYSWLVYNGLTQEEQSFILEFITKHNASLRSVPTTEEQRCKKAELAKFLAKRR